VADPLWGPDGTQPPPAPQAWADPVFGLVTGSSFESEPFTIELVEPIMPDMSEVRRAVDAVLSGEDEPLAPVVPRQRRKPPQTPRVTPGIVPPNPRAGWPRTPSVRQLPGLRPRTPGAARSPAARIPRPAGQRRPRGSSAGFVGLIIFILVIIVIIVTAIVSLLNTLSSLFG